MKNKHNPWILNTQATLSLVLLGICVVAFTGCTRSTTPSYYTLAPRIIPTTDTKLRVIELLPVNLPDRLNRVAMITNTEQGKSTILENNRWTSTLAVELHDGLSAGLQQQLNAVDRYNSGMSSTNTVYRIAVDFSRFDIVKSTTPQTNSNVEVEVSWVIKPIEPTSAVVAKQPLHRTLNCRMTFNQPIAYAMTIPDLVDASKQSLHRVTTNISNTVLAVERGNFAFTNVSCA